MFLGKKPSLGVDINDSSIEVLQLGKGGEVTAYGRAALEQGIVENGSILKSDALTTKLKEVLAAAKPKPLRPKRGGLKAILSLPESRVFVHHLELPEGLSEGELKKRVAEEAGKVIPFDLDQIYWDYLVTSANGKLHVLYIAAQKEIVDEYISTLRSAGIDAVAIDTESLSLGRALLGKLPLSNSVMIADIGARTTNISIFGSKGALNLSVTVPVAGDRFTEAVAKQLKVGNKEAEKLKRSLGFSGKKKGAEVLTALQPEAERIAGEIREAITFYREKFNDPVGEIILGGGSALLPDIDRYFKEILDKKVVVGDPFRKLSGKTALKKKQSILFANVIGLALRGIEDAEKGINLLRRVGEKKREIVEEEEEEKPQKPAPPPLGKADIIVIILIITSFVAWAIVGYFYVYKPLSLPWETLSWFLDRLLTG